VVFGRGIASAQAIEISAIKGKKLHTSSEYRFGIDIDDVTTLIDMNEQCKPIIRTVTKRRAPF